MGLCLCYPVIFPLVRSRLSPIADILSRIKTKPGRKSSCAVTFFAGAAAFCSCAPWSFRDFVDFVSQACPKTGNVWLEIVELIQYNGVIQ